MKPLLLVSLALLGMSPAAFASLTAVLSPNIAFYPPGADPAICLDNGAAPCVQFSGTLADTDTTPGAPIIFVYSVDIVPSADSSNFTFDGTFTNDAPGTYSNDANFATDGNYPNTYTGPLFGVDFDPSIPLGVYNETAEFTAAGGMGDPGYSGFTVDVDFTIEVTPEPTPALLILAGLVAMVLWHRRKRVC